MKRAALLLMLMPLLSGCSFVTLERQIYPICMSVDSTEDGGVRIGVQAPRSGGSSTEAASYAILTATGEDFDQALRTLSASTPYPLHFGQIRLCLIGYPLASSVPMRPLLDTLLELPTMRPNAYVSVAMGSGLAVMQSQQPEMGTRLSTHLSLLLSRMQREELLPDSSLSNCVREMSDGRSDLLIGISAVNERLAEQNPDQTQPESAPAWALGEPWSDAPVPEDLTAGLISHTSENPVEYLGSAAVSGGSVTGVLTADQTQLCLRLLQEGRRDAAREGERLQLQIRLKPQSSLAKDEEAIRDLIAHLQALGSDPLLFGCRCSMGFATQDAWEAYGFRQRYPHAEVWIGTEQD